MTLIDAAAVRGLEQPGSVDEAAELMRNTSGPLRFRGAGTKEQWGGWPAAPALVVETSRLRRLLAYTPADMTVAVQAGMPLRELQEVLGKEGQWLALDPPSEAAGATVGGLLAAGDSGPRRVRYGAMRDLVIGATIVLADGTVVRAGGTVIKNVAGYDLTKLVYGSLGSLGLVAEVVLRLHPRPETSTTLTVPCSVQRATEVTLQLLASPLEPAAVDWVELGGGHLALRFEGTRAGVDAQRNAATELLAGGDPAAAVSAYTDAQEHELWADVAAEYQPGPGEMLANVGTLPARTPDIARTLAEAGEAAGVSTRLACRPALGLHTAGFTGPAEAVARAVTTWRDELLAIGASVLLRERPAEVDALLDAAGPPPSSVGLLRALKTRLDPDGRCAPGRFGSWY